MFSQILDALKNEGSDGSTLAKGFHAAHELSHGSLHIEVQGVEKIKFSLNQTTIQKLQDVSSEAKYGLGEKTLIDKKVRDTQEIPKKILMIKCDGKKYDFCGAAC